MTAAERFDFASRTALLLEQVEQLRDDLGRHDRLSEPLGHIASGAWWALSEAVRGLVRATDGLVERPEPVPCEEDVS